MPITDSTKDYGTDEITIIWEGERPEDIEFINHAINNYGFKPSVLEIENPFEFKGLKNPGTAKIR